MEVEAQQEAKSIDQEMEDAEKQLGGVLSKVQHRFIEHTELSVAVHQLDDMIYRLKDNVSHVKGAAEHKQALERRAQSYWSCVEP